MQDGAYTLTAFGARLSVFTFEKKNTLLCLLIEPTVTNKVEDVILALVKFFCRIDKEAASVQSTCTNPLLSSV
jgi:hypothetical protein